MPHDPVGGTRHAAAAGAPAWKPAGLRRASDAVRPERLPGAALSDLRRLLSRLSSGFAERRVGEYDIGVPAKRLGIGEDGTPAGHRPFIVSVMGPGIGDAEIFEAEHAEEPDLKPYIGYEPTHAVTVAAMRDGRVDHTATPSWPPPSWTWSGASPAWSCTRIRYRSWPARRASSD